MSVRDRFSIGGVSDATGIKVVTIRYYEQRGLVEPPKRTEGNYRSYNRGHVAQLRFIKHCRDLGFTIEQIRELLRLSSEQKQSCSEVASLTRKHLGEIEKKIDDLVRLAGELRRMENSCRGDGRVADCRIMKALAS